MIFDCPTGEGGKAKEGGVKETRQIDADQHRVVGGPVGDGKRSGQGGVAANGGRGRDLERVWAVRKQSGVESEAPTDIGTAGAIGIGVTDIRPAEPIGGIAGGSTVNGDGERSNGRVVIDTPTRKPGQPCKGQVECTGLIHPQPREAWARLVFHAE